MKKKLIIIMIPIVCVLAIYSCKKEKKEEPETPPQGTGISLTPEKTTVMPFEVISFTNSGQGVLTANSYPVAFNGTAVSLEKIDDKLWMMLPDIAPGTYALTGTVEGSSVNINFTVNALPVIADPAAYYSNWQTEFLSGKQAADLLADSLVQAGVISSTALANDKNIITQMYDSANYYWNQLSAQEKIFATSLMESYKPIIDNLKEINNTRTVPTCAPEIQQLEPIDIGDLDAEKARKIAQRLAEMKCVAIREKEVFNQFEYALAKAKIKLELPKKGDVSIFGRTKQFFLATGYWLFCEVEEEFKEKVVIQKKEEAAPSPFYLENQLRAVNEELDAVNRTGITHIDCTNNIAMEIMPAITFESIKASDASSSYSIPRNYAVSLISLRNLIVNNLNSLLPAPLQLIPEFSNSSKTTVYNRDISIANISNSNVIGTCQLLNNQLMLKFHTTQTTTQNFTFDLVYTDAEVGNVSTNISGTLVLTAPVLAIGDNYQGGIIAYILQPADPGYDANVQHGLIAAPSDQSTGIQWYNGTYTSTGATADAIGAGNANTNAIVSNQGAGSYAAKLCADLVLGGYSDWFLPSTWELRNIYLNQTTIGGVATNETYWSSTETDSQSARMFFFNNSIANIGDKFNTFAVRAIRSF